MDIGQANFANGGAVVELRQPFKPFARPRLKRRRVSLTKPSLFAVRPNPSHYILDFSQHGKTVERAVSSLIQSDVRTVAVVGLPGSGKTVVLRGVAYHPSVYSYFPDGICFVQLSPQTTVETLFTHFCEILSRMNGGARVEIVKGLRKEGKHHSAMDIIARFLREKRFLLILDNLSDSDAAIVQFLSQLVTNKTSKSFHDTGRFTCLASTRSVDIARRFAGNSVFHLALHEPCGEASRDIVCAHAGFDRLYFDAVCLKENSPALPVLRKCSGLPLALAIAGGAIKRLLKEAKTTDGKELIWLQYKAYLFGNFDQFGEISGLFSALTACRLSIEAGQDWIAKISVLDVLCSLSIARYDVWMPFRVLQRLWDIKKKEDITMVVRSLSRVCLISREMRRGGAGISIPNIVIDFCDHLARKASVVNQWHTKLLFSYSGLHAAKANGTLKQGQEDIGTLQTTFDEDQYLQETLTHHFAKAISTSDGKTATHTRLKTAVNIIEDRIAKKYEATTRNKQKQKR